MNNNYVYEEKDVKNLTVKVYQDDDPWNPRTECDHLGSMFCFHNKYNLGDYKDNNYSEPDELTEDLETGQYIYLPLFLYDHSGITISTGAFSCPWDSGQVGYILVSKDKVKKEFSKKRISKKLLKKVYEILESEVKEYDQYLTGDVYGFVVEDEHGENLDSCWGFYGSDFCLEQGIESANWIIKEQIKDHLKKIKTWILNKVPVMYREKCPIQF